MLTATVTLDDVLLPVRSLPASIGDARIARMTQAMRAGDEDAWRELHGLYAGRLLRYLLVVTQGREDQAREALQLTFIRAVRHCRRFDQEASLWSWLTRLARSAVIDEYRKSSRYLGFLRRWFHERATVFAPEDAEDRLLQILQLELDRLPSEDRELITGKYFAGCRVCELAEQRETSEKAIESRLVRLRRQLRLAVLAHLQKEFHE